MERPIKQIGKKGRVRIRDRKARVKELRADLRYLVLGEKVFGICPDCGHWHHLTWDHKKKASQGGGNNRNNSEWVCNEPPCYCHHKRDNLGDPMHKKIKKQKANWQTEHECIHCKHKVRSLICTNCGKISIK